MGHVSGLAGGLAKPVSILHVRTRLRARAHLRGDALQRLRCVLLLALAVHALLAHGGRLVLLVLLEPPLLLLSGAKLVVWALRPNLGLDLLEGLPLAWRTTCRAQRGQSKEENNVLKALAHLYSSPWL